MNDKDNKTTDFIREIVRVDIESGKHNRIVTRFPPEPNGYLHIGHATSLCLNFGISEENEDAKCNLRFDDTNPTRETSEYVKSIKTDIDWLGFKYGKEELYASDYFETLYDFAIKLIQGGKAYVDSQTQEEMRINRGTLTGSGTESPFRDRTVEKNLELFENMRLGEYSVGTHTLRAKIDMSAPNINMRDPVMYRIIDAQHHQTKDRWKIYPLYDFAHAVSDSIEGITHSLCTLEYEAHRPLYEWFLNELDIFRSRQIEFGKVSMSHTILSKRNLLQLVEGGYVTGWDDPRMPTISGMRRLGYTAKAIKDFCVRIGITKRENTADIALLEHCVREDLNKSAKRVMAVLDPLKVVIVNYPENQTEMLEAINNPGDASFGTRQIPFSRELYIEKTDFMEDPPRKFFRLGPGREIRLRYGYFIKCERVIKDEASGEIIEVHCSYDPETKGGSAPDGRKVKSTIHWVSAQHSIEAEIRLYDRLCSDTQPDTSNSKDLKDILNPHSITVVSTGRLEPSMAESEVGQRYQFERTGYFCLDEKDSSPSKLVFNRTVTLRDTWAKIQGSKKN